MTKIAVAQCIFMIPFILMWCKNFVEQCIFFYVSVVFQHNLTPDYGRCNTSFPFTPIVRSWPGVHEKFIS